MTIPQAYWVFLCPVCAERPRELASVHVRGERGAGPVLLRLRARVVLQRGDLLAARDPAPHQAEATPAAGGHADGPEGLLPGPGDPGGRQPPGQGHRGRLLHRVLGAESGRPPAGLRARRLLRAQVPQEEEQALQSLVRGPDDIQPSEEIPQPFASVRNGGCFLLLTSSGTLRELFFGGTLRECFGVFFWGGGTPWVIFVRSLRAV